MSPQLCCYTTVQIWNIQNFQRIFTRYTRGHSAKFLVPPVWVDAYRFSFFPATVTLWNNLPTDVVLSITICELLQKPCGSSLPNSLYQVQQLHVLNCTELITRLFLSTVTHMLSTPVHHWQSSVMFLFRFYVFTLWEAHFLVTLASWTMHDDTYQWGYVC